MEGILPDKSRRWGKKTLRGGEEADEEILGVDGEELRVDAEKLRVGNVEKDDA